MTAGRLLLAVLAFTALAAAAWSAVPSATPTAPGATLQSTLVDSDGDGRLERGPAEPLEDRRELGAAGSPGEVLATFAQVSDLHIRDEESPARVPFLDRLGDPFSSTFRPHEALSPHVTAAAVRELNRANPDAVVVTGDMLDSGQANELELALGLLDGGRVRPDSGRRGYDGVQEMANPDPLYYRPDVDAPPHPGLLARAQEPFVSPGLTMPWLPVLGNHDLLVQGEVSPSRELDDAATGARAVVSVDRDASIPEAEEDSAAAVEALLAGRISSRERRVPADRSRRHLRPEELIGRLGRDPREGRLDYRADIGPHVRALVLDTVRREGGSRGVVTPGQVAWLEEELARAGRRWIVVFSHNPLESSDGGEQALAVLDRAPRVAAAVSGHRHRNTINPRRTPRGGYWMIGTSSLADFPQQARMFRLRRSHGGSAILETWMLDHDGAGLAGTARELAFLDAQGGRPQEFNGARDDRNVRLHLPR